MYSVNKRILIHLSLVGPLGPASILRLLMYICHQAKPELMHIGWYELIQHHESLPLEVVYTLSVGQLAEIMKLKPAVAAEVHESLKSMRLLEEELALIATHGIAVLTPFDDCYPEELKQITHPPMVLYCRGLPVKPLTKRIAIVGSRKASDYAHQVINALVPPLVAGGWTIVSGGAEGADTMAHNITLASGGTTIAVLGAGLLAPIYPPSNAPLFEKMVQQGSVVMSPFPLRMGHDRTTFPIRNRVISGLSLGSIIVQAAERSGALITARFALEQGRQVFAVPGLVNDELSFGCHYLIKQGAKLVHTVADVLEEFGETATDAVVRAPVKKKAFGAPVSAQQTVLPLEPEDPMLATLQEPATLDELQLRTGLHAEALQDRLFTLQLEGRIKQHFSGTWQRV